MKLYYLYTDDDGIDYFCGKYGVYSSTFLEILSKEEKEHMIEMNRLKDRYYLRETFRPTKKVIKEMLALEYAELERLQKERAKKVKDSGDYVLYDVLIESKLRDIEWYKFFIQPKPSKTDVLDKEQLLMVPISSFIEFKRGVAPCIFHHEKTPSMKFYPATNTIHCFGCGKTANAIQCMQQVRGCNFKTALQELARLL